MSSVSFADVVHQNISFNAEDPASRLVLELADTPWFQRLRDIRQTGNTSLVYMFAEHSRFGHCLGAAYLALHVMDRLALESPKQIQPYRMAVAAAALLHDIGHLAPGSHTAFKTWFPKLPDTHEALATRIIRTDPTIASLLTARDKDLPETVSLILEESAKLPAWTWEIISGGGWNIDRGNWSVVDSTLAGVSYGKYNINALIESLVLTEKGHLALRENRLDAMIHFAVSRQAMYRQIYQHRVILSADHLTRAIVQRARDLGTTIDFADDIMREALTAPSPDSLSLKTIFTMRESWWRYHLLRWMESKDPILADLSSRLLNRRLLKTIRVRDIDAMATTWKQAVAAVSSVGFDPKYYLHEISTSDMHQGDFQQALMVLMEDGSLRSLVDAEPLYSAMVKDSKQANTRIWLSLPAEAKSKLGVAR